MGLIAFTISSSLQKFGYSDAEFAYKFKFPHLIYAEI